MASNIFLVDIGLIHTCALPFRTNHVFLYTWSLPLFQRMTISAASLYTFGIMPIFGAQQLHRSYFVTPCIQPVLIFVTFCCPLHKTQNHLTVPVLSNVICPICKVLLWKESFSSHIIHQIKCTVWLQVTWNKECSILQCDVFSQCFTMWWKQHCFLYRVCSMPF